MADYKEMIFKRKVLGIPVRVEETKDGTQRSQFVYAAGTGFLLGTIWTDRWSKEVRAKIVDKPGIEQTFKAINVAASGLSKDQAFAELRRWIVAFEFKLPELMEMSA